jgi:two-component system chemotaxis sensor kinase CheA
MIEEKSKKIYIEEANELLISLESSLLVLEDDPTDNSNIELVFRVMHTLKGNSSMFGVAVVSEFVHDLETIYDKIRTGTLELTKEILDSTLVSLDHLKIIIQDTTLENAENKENHYRLIKQNNALIDNETTSIKSEPILNSEEQLNSFHIYFAPSITILKNGFNVLYLLSELSEIGKTSVLPFIKQLNELTEFDPIDCICSWDIIIETTQTSKEILDLFVFVKEDAKIEINELKCVDLVSNKEFKKIIEESFYQEEKIELSEILQHAKTFGKSIEIKKTEEVLALPLSKNDDHKKKSKKKSVTSIRVSSDKLDELMNLVSELVTTQAGLSLFSEKNKIQELEGVTENVEKLTRRLRDISFGMTLLPINTMFLRFQRMVRDTSDVLGKEVDFITEGGDTELDKTIIETLTDPLMHVIRNSLDHGIETREERLKKGKTAKGKLLLKAYYSGVFVYIQIIDDGKGMDPAVIRSKAIENGLITEEDHLSEKEIFNLIFYPGFSTASVVTDVSGRGVGMDVVKQNITDLKGTILVESKLNEGTSLTIKLPLTLSIIDGLLIDLDGVKYIVPVSVITKCYEVQNEDMCNNFNKLLLLDGEQVPFINLREEFGYKKLDTGYSQLIVVSDEENSVGISVDFIVGQYQAVIKPLGSYFRKQDFVSGATILGDGSIALVLDTHKIIELYVEQIKTEV